MRMAKGPRVEAWFDLGGVKVYWMFVLAHVPYWVLLELGTYLSQEEGCSK